MVSALANYLGDALRFLVARRVTSRDLSKVVGYFFDQRINTPQLSVSLRYSLGALSIE